MEAGIDDVGIGVLFGLFDWRFETARADAAHRGTSRKRSASARTRSACRASSRPPARTSPRTRRTPCPTSISARSSPSCGWPCPTRASSCRRARRPTSGARRSRSACRRSPPAAAPTPAATRGRASTRTQPVLARRPPPARRGHPRRRRTRLHPVVLHGLLPPRPHGRRLHGPGQARRDQGPLRPERALDVPGVPDDYGSEETRVVGERLVEDVLASMGPVPQQMAASMVKRVRAGKRDVFC